MMHARAYLLGTATAGLCLMAVSMWFAPELVGRLFRDAMARVPAVFGAG